LPVGCLRCFFLGLIECSVGIYLEKKYANGNRRGHTL
jgi:hypothetical protein